MELNFLKKNQLPVVFNITATRRWIGIKLKANSANSPILEWKKL